MERHNTDSLEGTDEDPKKDLEDTGSIDDEKLRCGFGGCSPRWLQCFHTARWLLVFLGMCAFIQSFVVNAIFPVGLSTLERQFKMSSTHTGIISSWYDFAVLLVVFPVCHWGNSGHKGRWIGLGGLVMAAGSFICALPHYMIAPYQPDALGVNKTIDFGQCFPDRTEQPVTCNESSWSSFLNPYFWMFILGQTLHGLGSTPLFSIGTAYIDENVSQKASPMYLAIHAVVTSLGPVIGLFTGGFLLRIYTDFDRVDSIPLRDDNDPRWLGAWWLGFLGSGISALLVAMPILGFARELPEAKRHRAKDVNQVHAVNAEKDSKESNLMSTVMGILRNPTFIVVIVLGTFESIIINGFAAFMPKILETLLATSPMVGAYLSSTVIFAAAFGVLVGGAVVRKLNLQVGGMLKMTLVCHVIALIFTFGFTLTCPQRNFVGINVGYDATPFHYGFDHVDHLSNTCNQNCHCSAKEWNPVCHISTGDMYYSPCLAGCKTQIERKKNKPNDILVKRLEKDFSGAYIPVVDNLTKEREYDETIWTDCSCLANATFGGEHELKSGYCSADCGWKIYGFLFALFITVVASFASGIPTQQIMLRVVPFDQRTIAIGIHWTFLRLLGFIPGGILFGVLIDNSCIKWGVSECGKKTSCLVYDPFKLSWTIMAVAIVCKLVSILGTVLGYMTYRPNDLDNGTSIQTTDSRGPLSLVVNDDRPIEEMGAPIKVT